MQTKQAKQIKQKNRQTRLKALAVINKYPTILKAEDVKPIQYNNDEFILSLNENKKPVFKPVDFSDQPKRASQTRKPTIQKQPQKQTSPPEDEDIMKLLMHLEQEIDNQSQPSMNSKALYQSNTDYSSRQFHETYKKEPVAVRNNSLKSTAMGNTEIVASRKPANKDIAIRNYNPGNVEEWSNYSQIPDSKLYYILRTMFKLKEFQNNQKAIIKCSLANNDVFVCMPTGGGKSLTFQLPLIYKPGVTVCVMPLISLIYDQEILSKRLGLHAYTATGNTSQDEFRQIYNQMRIAGELEQGIILLTTPEKMTASHKLLSELEQAYNKGLLNRIVIDEAHCVSTWGRDFREDYANLGFLKKKFPKTPVLALTATATEQVKFDVIRKLGIEQCYYFQSSFNRANLFYSVKDKGKKLKEQIVDICRKYSGQSGIIYCMSKKDCEKVSEMLNKEKIVTAYYHADLKNEKKKEVQENWMNNQIQVIVATIAFGMGINKPDVKFVIHQTISKSLENYYQQSGRAGRDGQPAECILFYRRSDKLQFMNFNMNNEFATKESKNFNQRSLLEMIRYGEDKFECRRVFQLRYLGENFTKQQCRKTCDNCQSNRQYREIECMAGIHQIIDLLGNISSIKEKLTLSQLAIILNGGANKKQLAQKVQFINRKGVQLDSLNFFRSWKLAHVEILLMNLINEGVLRQETYTSNKFTFSEMKVDAMDLRKFLSEHSSYSIKVESGHIGNKQILEQDENSETEEPEGSCLEVSSFDQYMCKKQKKVVVERESLSDEELFALLEADKNEKLLFKYMNQEVTYEPEVNQAVQTCKEETEMLDFLKFLEDNDVSN